jgi:catalase
VSFPQPIEGDKLRGRPEKFADHYTQATLFYRSQTPVERTHIMKAFRFELGRVQSNAVRERMVAGLVNVDRDLAAAVADGLGMRVPAPLPRVLTKPPRPEVEVSPAPARPTRRWCRPPFAWVDERSRVACRRRRLCTS